MSLNLKKLQTENFRNLNNQILEFSNGINCIFGDNGNGKTNILEAIHFLLTKKSFRKNTGFPQIISVESEKPQIIFSSLFEEDGKSLTYTGKISSEQSLWFLNNKPTKKKIELSAEFINPFDSYSFHSVPSFRRDWFDYHFSNISPEYKRVLKNFETTLRFRNKLLSKKPLDYKSQIKAIHPQLAEYSIYILKERIRFLESLNEVITETFKNIFDEKHILQINLESKFIKMNQNEIYDFYEHSIIKDDIICKTQHGIHRDDYVFNFDGFNSYEYCSLGQQKMSFLSLIFAYIELFRYKFTSYPIVLIDDVSGELDSRRWVNLINYLKDKKFQVMITTANENFRDKLEKIEGSKKFYIHHGNIEQL